MAAAARLIVVALRFYADEMEAEASAMSYEVRLWGRAGSY
jgi:hypothetical protein